MTQYASTPLPTMPSFSWTYGGTNGDGTSGDGASGGATTMGGGTNDGGAIIGARGTSGGNIGADSIMGGNSSNMGFNNNMGSSMRNDMMGVGVSMGMGVGVGVGMDTMMREMRREEHSTNQYSTNQYSTTRTIIPFIDPTQGVSYLINHDDPFIPINDEHLAISREPTSTIGKPIPQKVTLTLTLTYLSHLRFYNPTLPYPNPNLPYTFTFR